MRERGFHPIWPSLPGRKSQKLVRNPMANPSCWVTQTFKHPTILYRCTPQLRHPPNTNPSEMLTGIFFFSGKLIRRYLYKTLEIGLMTTPYHKENNGNWPSKSCDRSWSLSFCDSVRRSCRWTQFPVFFCHTKLEDPGYVKNHGLRPSQPKGVMSCLESPKLFPFKLGVVEGFFPNQMVAISKKSTTWGVNDFFLDSPSNFLNGCKLM